MSLDPTPLPPGWARARVPDVAAINPSQPDVTPPDDRPVSFVPMAAVEEMSGRLTGLRISRHPWAEVKKGHSRFQENDVLFAKITPCMENGKIAVASGLVNGIGAGSTEFHVLRPREAIHPQFLRYYLLQNALRNTAKSRMSGTAGQLRVPAAFLDELMLPLAPRKEQDRIVNAIDSYFSKLDAAASLLERMQSTLKRYWAAVLHAAVSGRLVPTEAELARRDGRDYEPVSVLIERVLSEWRCRQEEAEPHKLKAADKTSRGGRRKKLGRKHGSFDTWKLPELPDGWSWVRLDSISTVQLGQQRHPKFTSARAKLPYVRAANITWNGFDLGDVKEMDFPNAERYLLEFGDVLLSEASGSPMEAGKPAIWRGELPRACYQKTLLRVRAFDKDAILPEFLRLVFLRDCKAGKFARMAPGVGIVHITAVRLSEWAVPLAPLAEQHRIVGEVDRIESCVKDLTSEVRTQLRRLPQLRQAILKWAFEGMLVDQDLTDKPASALLEKIKDGSQQTAPGEKESPRRVLKRKMA